MKLIIEIDDEIYKTWKQEGKYASHSYAQRIILNGTPLPKGHGRLIDVNQIVYEKDCIWESDGCCTTISTPDIDATPTIIEAESEV